MQSPSSRQRSSGRGFHARDGRCCCSGQAKFSRCTFGNAADGGDFARATDPWVSSSPNGVRYQIADAALPAPAGGARRPMA